MNDFQKERNIYCVDSLERRSAMTVETYENDLWIHLYVKSQDPFKIVLQIEALQLRLGSKFIQETNQRFRFFRY